MNKSKQGSFRIDPAYLKEGDIVKHGPNNYVFISFRVRTELSFGGRDESTYMANVLTIPDNEKKIIRFLKGTKVVVLNDAPISSSL